MWVELTAVIRAHALEAALMQKAPFASKPARVPHAGFFNDPAT
jgi:hypothetical protein